MSKRCNDNVITCKHCGDDSGMKGLMEGLLDVWEDVGYDQIHAIHCPMCGNRVEVIYDE